MDDLFSARKGDITEVIAGDSLFDGFVSRIGDDDGLIVIFGPLFEAGSDVDAIANGGVVHPFFGAHVADDGETGMDADTDLDRNFFLLTAVFIEFLDFCKHVKCGEDAVFFLVLIFERSTEFSHDPIADELIKSPVVFEDDRNHPLEVFVEEVDDLFRRENLREVSKATDIGKEDGDFTSFPLHLSQDFRLENSIEDVMGDVSCKAELELLLLLDRFGHGIECIGKIGEFIVGFEVDTIGKISSGDIFDGVDDLTERLRDDL